MGMVRGGRSRNIGKSLEDRIVDSVAAPYRILFVNQDNTPNSSFEGAGTTSERAGSTEIRRLSTSILLGRLCNDRRRAVMTQRFVVARFSIFAQVSRSPMVRLNINLSVEFRSTQ